MSSALTAEKTTRRRFCLTLAGSASVYGAIWAYRLLGWQADSVTDIFKMSGLIFLTTLCTAYIWWRLIRSQWRGLWSGVFAGGLTALTVIPMPTFFGGLKTRLLEGHDIIAALELAAEYSVSTFSLAEFIAIPMSMAVGMWASGKIGIK